MLDNAGLKDLLTKNGDACREAGRGRASPGGIRMGERWAEEPKVPTMRSIVGKAPERCRVIGADRTSMRYQTRRSGDGPVRERLRALAHQRRRFGYRRLHACLVAA